MIFKLTPKRCRDVKTVIDAETKKPLSVTSAAIQYLTEEELLKNQSIKLNPRIAFIRITISKTSRTPSLFISADKNSS